MPPALDLTDAEAAALGAHLRRTIENDRFPLVPRLAPLRAILDKLVPPAPQPEPPPPLSAGTPPSRGCHRKRR